MIRTLLLLIVLSLFFSCKTSKTASSTVDIKSTAYVLDKISKTRFNPEWWSAKAIIKVESPEMSMGFTSYIRLMKDSLIWINFKKLSIEAARAIITKDSVFVINYFGKEYIARDLKYLEKSFNLPASFDIIQDMLLGNPVLLDTAGLVINADTASYMLHGKSGAFKNKYWFDAASFGLNGMEVYETNTHEKIYVEQSNFQDIGKGRLFPLHRNIRFLDSRNSERSADIEFSEIEVNAPKAIKFEVPEHYKRL